MRMCGVVEGGVMRALTINDLMTICTIVTCDQCGLDHAPVRTCQETALAALTEKEQS